MANLKKRLYVSLLAALCSVPVIWIIISFIWNRGLFDYGTGISQLSFTFFMTTLISNPYILAGLIFYGGFFLYFHFFKVLKNGIGYWDIFLKGQKKELIFCYGIVFVIAVLGGFFPVFASMFVPVAFILLIPVSCFHLSITKMIER
ncbi:hypothetical protein [uncultured Traorella sp.]|uniref:hypothetical protein n=1 Tax=uncultured Traorella sp. TaxID=1929048 RepID=UPI0025FE7F36|nr:hypothetical protein [uncultured Traorella sp.]